MNAPFFNTAKDNIEAIFDAELKDAEENQESEVFIDWLLDLRERCLASLGRPQETGGPAK